jgi:diacylglycerol kinase (ATP)
MVEMLHNDHAGKIGKPAPNGKAPPAWSRAKPARAPVAILAYMPPTPARARATLIVNPTARGVSAGFDGAPLLAYLRRRGIDCSLRRPGSAAEATGAAREAALRGDDMAFVLGGDGTLRDVAAGLGGSNTALAALPRGTVNVWCREMGIPLTLRAALDSHLSGRITRIDLGLAGGRPFLLMASAGWDAAVTRAVSPRVKARFGDLAYILRALQSAPRVRTVTARWHTEAGNHECALAMMVISNTRLYGGRVRFTPASLANDGLLDTVALCPRSRAGALRMAARVLTGRPLAGGRDILTARIASLTIETPGIPVQLDGDYAGQTPMSFAVQPAALAVSVPAGALPPVLGG